MRHYVKSFPVSFINVRCKPTSMSGKEPIFTAGKTSREHPLVVPLT